MSRISSKLLHNRAKEACEAVGLTFGPGWTDRKAQVGAVHLDNVPMYGGWDLAQIANEGGGITQLNGHCNRLKASEMLAFLDGMILAARLLKAVRS